MIKIKKLENEVRDQTLLAYDVGEIVKIEANPSMDSANMEFYDSKGVAFVSAARLGRARDDGFCTIYASTERKDVFPVQYRKVIFAGEYRYGTRIACNDPRVLWADIVAYWAFKNKKCESHEELSFFLTEFLPSYEEAAIWLKKNRFPVFATRDYSDKLRDSYYQDYGDLDVPPEIDWSKVPDSDEEN